MRSMEDRSGRCPTDEMSPMKFLAYVIMLFCLAGDTAARAANVEVDQNVGDGRLPDWLMNKKLQTPDPLTEKNLNNLDAIRLKDPVKLIRADHSDELIQQINRGTLRISLGYANRQNDENTEMTVEGRAGSAAAKAYDIGLSDRELALREREGQDCTGELDDGIGDKTKILRCFTSLAADSGYQPVKLADNNGYLKGLANLSSIIDAANKHVCDASVIRPGRWVTAKHCFEENGRSGLKVIVGNRTVAIKDINDCAGACDIAYFNADTPENAVIPKLYRANEILTGRIPVFIPGIPYSTDLSSIFTRKPAAAFEPATAELVRQRYGQFIIWAAYNRAFCLILHQDANGCFIHTCSTVRGFSGAPIYTFNESTGQLYLIGIHSGAQSANNQCVHTYQKVNYARRLVAEEF